MMNNLTLIEQVQVLACIAGALIAMYIIYRLIKERRGGGLD